MIGFPKPLCVYKVIKNGRGLLMVIRMGGGLIVCCTSVITLKLHHSLARLMLLPQLLQVKKLLRLIINLPKVTLQMRSKP